MSDRMTAEQEAPAPDEVRDALEKLETALRFLRNGITVTGDEGIEYMLALMTLRRATEGTPNQEEKMRAEFFAWVNDCGCDTDGAWSAWQAATLAAQARTTHPLLPAEDEQLEALLEESGGYWKEDVFCIAGGDLMSLLRAASITELQQHLGKKQ